jgi:hypothetical protein
MILLPAAAVAEIPILKKSTMRCLRSAQLMACADKLGTHYTVALQGSDTFIRGYDAATGQSWAQTGTRFGPVQFLSGVSSNGQLWIGSNRRVGWTAITRLSTSDGDQARLMCNRLSGCN